MMPGCPSSAVLDHRRARGPVRQRSVRLRFRAGPRRALPAALPAVRGRYLRDPLRARSKACYERLRTRGKPRKVALVAVMRRLVALLREDGLWQVATPARATEAAA